MTAALTETSKPTQRDFLTVTEFAYEIGRSYSTAIQLVRAGKVEGVYRVGGVVVVPRASVDKIKESRATGAR